MSQEKYLIHELAEMAGTTVRTIRYYTDEGLLSPPEYDGKYANYNPKHLHRLQLIRQLKDAYLPLSEIRQIMLSISDDEVVQRLKEYPSAQPKPGALNQLPKQDRRAGSDALNYINQLMEEQTIYREKGKTTKYPSEQQRNPAGQTLNNQSKPEKLRPEGESWQRFTIAPGVELLLRQPPEPDTSSRVQQLILYAQKLFRSS